MSAIFTNQPGDYMHMTIRWPVSQWITTGEVESCLVDGLERKKKWKMEVN